MRLIDADALIALIKKRLKNELIIGWLCGIIAEAPTIEARPVVRGKWCWITEDIYGCDNCGQTSHVKEVMGHPDWDFCPNCGADMRGAEDG